MADTVATEAPAAAAAASPAAVAKSPKKPKAAAGPKKPKVPAAHPPVNDMIFAAVKALNERNGSSLQAIKKYVAANYKADVTKLSTFIKKALKSGVTSGKLVQTKGTGASGSFKLSAAAKKPPVEKKKKVVAPKKKKSASAADKKEKIVIKKKAAAGEKKPKKVVKKTEGAAAKKTKAAAATTKKPKAAAATKKPKAAEGAKKAAKKPAAAPKQKAQANQGCSCCQAEGTETKEGCCSGQEASCQEGRPSKEPSVLTKKWLPLFAPHHDPL
ncbi:histone H1 [Anopheles darlingi]|uniref:Histone H1 n=1 Tax=Anopheles darlingi TaxID=43151 RepID=W5J6I0_ANODA|nr:histone H1 [Anopheles darlingi]